MRLSVEEMLQDECLPVVLQEKLLSQDRALSRMNQLVKNLLDLSGLELIGGLEKETFSLNGLMAALVDDFQLLMFERKITFIARSEDDLFLLADREKFRRMLINLLDNAIKYNMVGGQIVFKAERGKAGLALTLANTGLGISKEDQPRIFDQFYRCERSRSAAHGGSGLGLTIVKRIVELHGGSIAVESEPFSWIQMIVRFLPDIFA